MAGTTWAAGTRASAGARWAARTGCAPPTPDPAADPPKTAQPWALTILVVEDDADIRELVTRRLARSGYEVRTAGTGWAALTAVAERRPDLVVLDLAIPGPDGIEVCRRLREDDETADLPVILLTAAGETHRHEGMAAGADRYLTKPFSPRRLAAEVATLLPGPDHAA